MVSRLDTPIGLFLLAWLLECGAVSRTQGQVVHREERILGLCQAALVVSAPATWRLLGVALVMLMTTRLWLLLLLQWLWVLRGPHGHLHQGWEL